MGHGLTLIERSAGHPQETLQNAVHHGLQQTPKQIPSRFFYDEAGSLLFERITTLKEYYPTRTERAILATEADSLLDAIGVTPIEIVELGSGNSCKTRLLLEAALRRQSGVHYLPIDISGAFLRSSAELLLHDYPKLRITAIAAEYLAALDILPRPELPRLFVFLGGNIGNFEFEEAVRFLLQIRQRMRPQDRLLVGVDQIKDIALLTAAYNDAEGVTAAFNKNLLYRINRELNADFNPDAWIHAAPFVEKRSRIEMWLLPAEDQTVTVEGVVYHFRQGEGIHTENSHKYTIESFNALCRDAGLIVQQTYTDAHQWFSVHLLRPRTQESQNGR